MEPYFPLPHHRNLQIFGNFIRILRLLQENELIRGPKSHSLIADVENMSVLIAEWGSQLLQERSLRRRKTFKLLQSSETESVGRKMNQLVVLGVCSFNFENMSIGQVDLNRLIDVSFEDDRVVMLVARLSQANH
jgi:hypothetical protein